MKQQRRVFLKVLAAGPLMGCAGAGPDEQAPGEGMGASDGVGSMPGGGGTGSSSPSGGSLSSGGSFANGGSFTRGGTFTNGGTFTSGGTFATTGGGSTSPGGASTGTDLPGEVVAHLSAIQLGSLTIVGGLFFMGRDAGGIYAMSMQCTHKGCAVGFAGSILECPCHQARFDLQGNVLAGPATAPLPYFAVYIDAAGNISVDRFTVVSADARVAV